MRTREEIKQEIAEAKNRVDSLERELAATIDVNQDIVSEIVSGTHQWSERMSYHRDAITEIISYYIKRKRAKNKVRKQNEAANNRRLASANIQSRPC